MSETKKTLPRVDYDNKGIDDYLAENFLGGIEDMPLPTDDEMNV